MALGAVLWDFATLGSEGTLLADIVDGDGGQWVAASPPASDSPHDLTTYSSNLCLAVRQANAGGAYDRYEYDLWSAYQTQNKFRFRILGYQPSSDTSLNTRIGLFMAGNNVLWQITGTTVTFYAYYSSTNHNIGSQSGYSTGAYTLVGELTGTRVKWRRVSGHNPSLAFGSWDKDLAFSALDVTGYSLAIGNGNAGSTPAVHGYIKTLEALYDWILLAGILDGSSALIGALKTSPAVLLAGSLEGQGALAGSLITTLPVDLAGILPGAGALVGDLSGGTPWVGGDVRLSAPGAALEMRRLPFDWVRAGEPITEVYELVAANGHPGPLLWCDADGWLEVSVAGGPYQPVGTSRATAVNVGVIPVGGRITVEFRLTPPALADDRSRLIHLSIGLGTG